MWLRLLLHNGSIDLTYMWKAVFITRKSLSQYEAWGCLTQDFSRPCSANNSPHQLHFKCEWIAEIYQICRWMFGTAFWIFSVNIGGTTNVLNLGRVSMTRRLGGFRNATLIQFSPVTLVQLKAWSMYQSLDFNFFSYFNDCCNRSFWVFY